MSYFKAKMHQFRFRLGSAADPAGSLQRSSGPLGGFQGPTSNGKEGVGEGEDGENSSQ